MAPLATVQDGLDPALLASIDTLTRNFLQRAGVTAAQLAIVRDHKVVHSKVFAATPPPGSDKVTNRTLFRIASCGKMFTCAAIEQLRSKGKLDLQQKVFPLLKIDAPAMPKEKPDPRIDDVTIGHLVAHAGGWNDHETCRARDGTNVPGTSWDPTFGLRTIALEMKLPGPPTKLQLARYMYGKPLQFTPGTQDFNSTGGKSYSNFGYMLLGMVIEAVIGKSYIDFLHDGLDSSVDMSMVQISPMLSRKKDPREVWYVENGTGPTVFDPRSSEMLPWSQGGGGFITEVVDSAGGLMTTAETLALFSARHAVWGLGGRAPGSERSGGLAGTASRDYTRPNGIDCAYILNRNHFLVAESEQEVFAKALRDLLDRL
jgi:CubicO group peptidase (beta-lactamase class C family)